MTPLRGESADRLDWLIDGLVERVPEVTRAVLLSADGLLLGASSGLDRADADYLSALAAGLQSLAQGARSQFDAGVVHQTIIEMSNTFLFVTAAGQSASLTVLSDSAVDPKQISYEMTILVKRVGEHLSSSPRQN